MHAEFVRVLVPPHTFPSYSEARHWRKNPVLKIADLKARLFASATSPRYQRAGLTPETHYIAAVNSITAMTYYSPQHFKPLLRYSGPGEDLPVSTNFYIGNWELTPCPTAVGVEIASLEERIRWQEELRAYYRSNPALAEREIHLLWDWLVNEVLAPAGEQLSEILAAGINAWHQTQDPHARVLPTGYLEENFEARNEARFEDQLQEIQSGLVPTILPVRLTYIKLNHFYLPGAVGTILKTYDPITDAFVLDLRGNGGGYFEDTRQYLNLFLDPIKAPRQFYVTKSRSALERESFLSQGTPDTKKPLVLLVDATTKSAAELFAGVLQQYQRAWIVGDTTFGKGTSISVTETFGGGAVLRESTHVLHYPNGGSPQLVGVTPDIYANPNPNLPRVMNLYVDPLPREAPHFIQPRADEIRKLLTCIDAWEWKNPRLANDIRHRDYKNDYALVRALLLMQCQLRGAPPK